MAFFEPLYTKNITELQDKRKTFKNLVIINLALSFIVYFFVIFIYLSTHLVGLVVIGVGLYVVEIILAIDASNYVYVIDNEIRRKKEKMEEG